MQEIFQVKKASLKRLNDEQARELVARLCKAECRTLGLPESAVTWGGDQRAKDGGVDVRVKLIGNQRGLDFIPKPSAAFQVKAEAFPPSKIPDEVAPTGKPRDIYGELAKEDGAYIIVSTRDDCSDSALLERTSKIRDTLAAIGFGSSFSTDFYCLRRLADWVEKYPPVVTWVRNVLGEPLVGWSPYGAWAYKEHDVNAEYLVDDRVRVFVPGAEQGRDVLGALDLIRLDLQRPGSIRIVGLSGVGKTRLVQAIFDKRVQTAQPVPSAENVIYCDLAGETNPQPGAIIEALASKSSDAILVVDNCSAAEHARLTERALMRGRNLKLITIEYDIRDDVPERTSAFRLEGSSKDIIFQLLKRHYPILSVADAERIAEYSDGNARVAFALAETAENAGDFARLRNHDLFARLFHQKRPEDDGLLRSAEVASLLFSFDGEDNSSGSEIAVLAAIADCSVPTFIRHMAELSRRGLLQKRGAWRAVLPHAIANQLATSALENMNTPALVQTLFVAATPRVARSFSKRLGYLHDCRQAVDIARAVLSENGQLGDIRASDEFQSQMFANFTSLCPKCALASIERAQADPEFVSSDNFERTDIIRLVRAIAYDSEFFEETAELLVAFSVVEPQGYNRDPATDALVSLFYVLYSGTQAPLEERLKVARALLYGSEGKKRELGFKILSAGLKTSQFMFHYSPEFGSRHRDYGWSPTSKGELTAWFVGWLDLALDVLHSGDEASLRVRSVLGDTFRGLWGIVPLQDRLMELADQLTMTESWPEGWLATKRILRRDSEKQSKTSLAKLRRLERALRPKDLLSEIRARVLARGAFVDDSVGVDRSSNSASSIYQQARDHAEKLGEAAATDDLVLKAAVPELLRSNSSDKTYSFGRGVGKAIDDPLKLMNQIRAQIANSENDQISTISIRGIIAGWNEADPKAVGDFLDTALEDEIWSRWFVELQVQGSMDDRAFDRLLSAIADGKSPVWQFRYLAGGRATDPFSAEQVGKLVRAINDQEKDGCFVAFDLLSMVIHCAAEKDENYRNDLLQVCMEFLRVTDWKLVNSDNGGMDYDVDVVLRFVLSHTNSENEVGDILDSIVVNRRNKKGYSSFDGAKLLKPFFEFFPTMALNAVYRPDDEGSYSLAYEMVADPSSEEQDSAVAMVPLENLIEWCNISPSDRFPYAASTCKLFDMADDQNRAISISQTVVELLRSAPNKQAVVSEVVPRLVPSSWSGSRASIIEERLPLLRSINPADDQEIERAIDVADARLRELIDAERRREMVEERTDSESFE
ncbi:hypothetical protein NKJ70_00345 [Mesorhizobium sp. M0092]|uniref:hypothetical protein n=1 Tax=Mesorhizobium sp. M0092 TaxID=2956876 RepID=UPI0033368BF1